MTQRQRLHATPITLDVGDSVLKRSPEESCRLALKFMGPFLVTAKLHGNKFKVLDLSTSLSEVIHADRLKKVCSALSPVADTSPLSPDLSFSASSGTASPTHGAVPPPVSSVSPPDCVCHQKLRSACQV